MPPWIERPAMNWSSPIPRPVRRVEVSLPKSSEIESLLKTLSVSTWWVSIASSEVAVGVRSSPEVSPGSIVAGGIA